MMKQVTKQNLVKSKDAHLVNLRIYVHNVQVDLDLYQQMRIMMRVVLIVRSVLLKIVSIVMRKKIKLKDKNSKCVKCVKKDMVLYQINVRSVLKIVNFVLQKLVSVMYVRKVINQILRHISVILYKNIAIIWMRMEFVSIVRILSSLTEILVLIVVLKLIVVDIVEVKIQMLLVYNVRQDTLLIIILV